MKKKTYSTYLFSILFILIPFSGMAITQDITPLSPPPWSPGDWWSVESQVYDLGKVVPGPAQPGWRPKKAWRFQVEKLEAIGDQPYFVVSIKPIHGNSCPYSFRFWFRVSDRFVGRHELIHPSPTPSKPKVIGPPVVTTDLSPTDAAPFFTTDFPTLPITVPLFQGGMNSVSFPAGNGGFETSQKLEKADALRVAEKADSNLLKKMGGGMLDHWILVRIHTKSGMNEQQYWKHGAPWCLYGERINKTYTSRRYWLVDMGKD